MKRRTYDLTVAAVIAAAYVVLTLPFAQFSFGIIQFRLAEAMTVIAVLTPAAIPGLTLGCLLANLLNPMNLGPVDIIVGTAATLIAAWLSWKISSGMRMKSNRSIKELGVAERIVAISPAVVINAIIVGTYLPYLLLEDAAQTVAFTAIVASIGSILLCEAVVVYLIGLPLLLALGRTKISR